MPYITQKEREQYQEPIDQLVELLAQIERREGKDAVKGHHNYIMYTVALRLAHKLGIKYHTFNDIMGTFESCKLEFYRRIVAPYEDKAIKRNGDVEDQRE